jgi:hypothetical protein
MAQVKSGIITFDESNSIGGRGAIKVLTQHALVGKYALLN